MVHIDQGPYRIMLSVYRNVAEDLRLHRLKEYFAAVEKVGIVAVAKDHNLVG